MNYKRLGDYIKRISVKNTDGLAEILYGINIDKFFMPSVANVIGTDLTRYKVVSSNQFACNRMHVGRDKRLPIALSDKDYDFIVSPAYDVFEINDVKALLPEYLMMWFTREEFDRNCWFHTDSDVRGKLDWNAFMDMTLPIPSIEKQQQIVDEYNTVTNRIQLNEKINTNLEATAQALYKHWFVDYKFCQLKMLKDCVESANTGLDAIKRAPIVIENTGIKCLRIQDVSKNKRFDNWGFTKVSLTNYEKFKLKKNDLIIARTGATVGVNMFIKKNLRSVFNNGLIRIKTNQSIHPTILNLIFKTSEFKEHIRTISFGTATQPNMKIEELLSYELLIPKIEIQNNFVHHFLALDNQIMINEDINNSLVELQSLLLAKMTQVVAKARLV